MPRYSTVHGGTSNEALRTGVALFFLSLSVNTISTDLYMCETEPDLTIPANRRLEFEASSSSRTANWAGSLASLSYSTFYLLVGLGTRCIIPRMGML